MCYRSIYASFDYYVGTEARDNGGTNVYVYRISLENEYILVFTYTIPLQQPMLHPQAPPAPNVPVTPATVEITLPAATKHLLDGQEPLEVAGA